MGLTSREKKMVIGIAVAVVIAALILAFLLGRGTGKDAVTTSTAPTVTRTTPTTPTQTVVTVTTTAPAPAPAPAAALEITERSASPEVVSAGAPMTFTARVRGAAASVTMTVYKRDTGVLAITLPLAPGAAVAGVTTWSAGTTAPVDPGEYRYHASAVSSDGATVEMPGVSGWTFLVNP